MGSDLLIRIKKFVVISSKVCYRSVSHHPFHVGFLCWLYIFYRSFPVLFSLFVSASPVLVTTALLLGTLLSYGESNLPEYEEEVSERSTAAAYSSSEVGVVEIDAGFDSRKLKSTSDLEGEVKKEGDSDDESGDDDCNRPFIKRKGDIEKVREVVRSLEDEDEKELSRMLGEESGRGDEGGSFDGESVVDSYALVPNVEYERLESDDYRLLGDPYSLNSVYTSFSLSPKREEAGDHQRSDSENENAHVSETGSGDDDDESSSDSESDGGESSSPDASMTDIAPLLDDLHPLLDEDAPQPAHGDGTSTAQRSANASSLESAEDSENQDDEDGEDKDGNDDNEEDAQSNNGEKDKPEITWTEDDQKNLMDMGTSELERNQRLENLIARRRARKMMRLADVKNLIDLESTDLPFNVPHISTLRRNPFDAPLDSYDMMGLPPIPGSAPSLLQPRRNPFDLPYDQNEEKPILTGDNFAQEFIPPQRDAFFRRYESFSVGPSTSRSSRKLRWTPDFGPARTAEAYASIQRQLSEVSESKASSVLETESVLSATDHEDRTLTEPDVTNMVSEDEHDSDHSVDDSQTSEDAESIEVEHVNRNEFEIQLGDRGSLHETETNMAVIEETHSHVESGQSEITMRVHAVDEDSEGSSHSSPTIEMQAEHDEISMEMGSVSDGFQHAGASFSGSVETVRSEMHLPTEQVDDGSDSSSATSLSETNEEVSNAIGRTESIGENVGTIEDSRSVVAEPSIDLKVEIPDPDDHHIKEPVYDSSPTPVENHIWFSSASIDSQPESLEVSSNAVGVESETQHRNKDFEEVQEPEVIAGSSSEGMHIDSSLLSTADENQETHSTSQTVGQEDYEPSHEKEKTLTVISDVGQTSLSAYTHQPHSTDADTYLLGSGEDQSNLKAEQVSEIDGGSSSSETESSEQNYASKEDMPLVELDAVQSLIQDDNESLAVQDSNVGPDESSDSDSLEDHTGSSTLQIDRDELPSHSSDNDTPNQEPVSAESSYQHAESEGESSLSVNQKQNAHETPTTESSSDSNQEITEASSSDETAPRTFPVVSVAIPLKNRLIESIKGMSSGGIPSDKLEEFQTPVSARYFDFSSEDSQPNVTHIDEVEGETDNFKDLDEGLLAELDRVGDFSVPNTESYTELPITGMGFHHIHVEVPVEEVTLPSLLFDGRAVADSIDVHASNPNSPISDTKEVSPENEESASQNTDAQKSEVAPTSSDSSSATANTELKNEDVHTQEQDPTENPKQSPEETQAKSPKKKKKSHDSSSSSSESDSD